MITNPKSSPENEACKDWVANLVSRGVEVVIPEIADCRLDALKGMLSYAPITTTVMLKAAEFWAQARRMGRQSADDASLDADMILAAQKMVMVSDGDQTVIATTNVRHLALFSSAHIWREIS